MFFVTTHTYLPWLFYFPHPLSKVVQSRSYRCPRRALGNYPKGNTRTKPGIRTSVTHVWSSAYVNIQSIYKNHAIWGSTLALKDMSLWPSGLVLNLTIWNLMQVKYLISQKQEVWVFLSDRRINYCLAWATVCRKVVLVAFQKKKGEQVTWTKYFAIIYDVWHTETLAIFTMCMEVIYLMEGITSGLIRIHECSLIQALPYSSLHLMPLLNLFIK